MMPYLPPKLVSGEKQNMKLCHAFKLDKSLKPNSVIRVVSSFLSLARTCLAVI